MPSPNDTTDGESYHLVGCTHCDHLWVLPNKNEPDRAVCPRCLRSHETDLLRTVAVHDSRAAAAEARSRRLAARTGRSDEYQDVLDEHGQWGDQLDTVEERLEERYEHLDEEADQVTVSADADLADVFVEEGQWNPQSSLEADLADVLVPDDYEYTHQHADGVIADAQVDPDDPSVIDENHPSTPDCPPADPALEVRKQARVTATHVDLTNETPTAAWRTLLDVDVLTESLAEAVRTITAETPRQQHGRVLRGHGLEAGHGALAERTANLALESEHEAHSDALDVLRNLGNTLGLDASSDVLEALSYADVDASIDVHLDRAWFDLRSQQRRTVLQLLIDASRLIDVHIVASGLVQHRLHAQHYEQLTPGVRESINRHRTKESAHPDSSVAVQQRLSDALQTLDPDGAVAGTLRRLAASDTGIMSYEELRAADASSPEESNPVRTRLHKLAQLELVDRWGPQTDKRAEITAVGRRYLEETTHQSTLADSVFSPPKSIDNSRGSRASTQETPGPAGAAAEPSDSRDNPAHEPRERAEASSQPRCRMGDGIAGIRYWNRQEEAVYRKLTPERGIALHDTPIDKQDDRREPSWGYDGDDEHLLVGAEYDNPMQYTVSIARALASTRTWSRVLTPSRVESDVGNLSQLAVSENNLLRDLCDVGWLDRYDGEIDYTDLRDAYAEARADLMDLTTELASLTNADGDRLDDVDEDEYLDLRSEITQHALGLTGSMLMLLWLAGIDVSRVVLIPEYNRNFTGDSHLDRRVSLAKHLGIQGAICSQHHGQPLYRQLYDQREHKQNRAIDPRPEVGTPHGNQLGQVLVVGPSVDNLENHLEEHVETPLDTREDAPEIGATIPIRTEVPRTSYAELINWRLTDKGGLRPSRQAVNLLRALFPDPLDGIEVLRWLSSELSTRGVRLDELRYGITQALEVGAISEDRLLPGVKPTERAIIRTLLAAERPISGAEVHQRGDISAQSWRNNRGTLVDLNLIVETDQGWRLCLPFTAEETEQVVREVDDRNIYTAADDPDSLVNIAAPWYLLTEAVVASDLMETAVLERLPRDAVRNPDHPVASVFYQPPIRPWGRVWDRYPDLESWFRVARALTAAPDPEERTVTMGCLAPQTRLSAFAKTQQRVPGPNRVVGDD